jgi:hypothetical protein
MNGKDTVPHCTLPNDSDRFESETGLSFLAMNDYNVSLTIWAEIVNISLQDALSKNVLALEMMEWLIFFQSNSNGSKRTVGVLYGPVRSGPV